MLSAAASWMSCFTPWNFGSSDCPAVQSFKFKFCFSKSVSMYFKQHSSRKLFLHEITYVPVIYLFLFLMSSTSIFLFSFFFFLKASQHQGVLFCGFLFVSFSNKLCLCPSFASCAQWVPQFWKFAPCLMSFCDRSSVFLHKMEPLRSFHPPYTHSARVSHAHVFSSWTWFK